MTKVKAALISILAFIILFQLFRYILVDLPGVWNSVEMLLGPYATMFLIPPVIVGVVTFSSLLVAVLLYQVLRGLVSVWLVWSMSVAYGIGLLAVLLLKSRGIQGFNLNPLNIIDQFVNAPMQLVFNLVLFVPVGYILLMAIGRLRIVLVCSLLMIIIIESIQLLCALGMFDIVDIILNLIGVTVGALMADVIKGRWSIEREKNTYILRSKGVKK